MHKIASFLCLDGSLKPFFSLPKNIILKEKEESGKVLINGWAWSDLKYLVQKKKGGYLLTPEVEELACK